MRVSKRQLERIIREQYFRLKIRQILLKESFESLPDLMGPGKWKTIFDGYQKTNSRRKFLATLSKEDVDELKSILKSKGGFRYATAPSNEYELGDWFSMLGMDRPPPFEDERSPLAPQVANRLRKMLILDGDPNNELGLGSFPPITPEVLATTIRQGRRGISTQTLGKIMGWVQQNYPNENVTTVAAIADALVSMEGSLKSWAQSDRDDYRGPFNRYQYMANLEGSGDAGMKAIFVRELPKDDPEAWEKFKTNNPDRYDKLVKN